MYRHITQYTGTLLNIQVHYKIYRPANKIQDTSQRTGTVHDIQIHYTVYRYTINKYIH
jgi:hypothetical protein